MAALHRYRIGASSFVDEGVDATLDILQEKAAVNSLVVAPLTWDQSVAGRSDDPSLATEVPSRSISSEERSGSPIHATTGTASFRGFGRRPNVQ
jgi:hypothetical protein